MGFVGIYLQLLCASMLLCGIDARGGLAGAKGFKCPNKCSGHGACMQDNVCLCQPGWDAKLLPDCSLRECPKSAAWADKARDDDLAHSNAECSNMGFCNRRSGNCECYSGFTGAACERMACTLDCSGNGRCMTEGDLYSNYNTARDKTLTYTNWESRHVQGCVCDPGYTGGRCELKFCPKGNDPIIPTHNFPTYILTTHSSSGTLDGLMKFTFHDKSFVFPATVANWDAAACKRSFESLPNIKTVECVAGAVEYAGGGAAYTIQITAFPSNPYENNLYTHRGQPLVDSFHCDTSQATNSLSNAIECTMTEVQYGSDWDIGKVYVPLYEQCSNRGLCDMATGSCECYPNFYGSACSSFQPNGVVVDLIDVMSITLTNANFRDASVLHLADTVRGGSRWSSIVMETTNNFDSSRMDNLFNMTSWGDIVIKDGGINILGPDDGDTGLYVHRGGLRMAGGLTIASGGLEIVPAGDIAGTLHLDASVTMNGGLVAGNYMQVNDAGIVVQGGMTIDDGGLMVPHCGYVADDLSFQYRQGLWCDDPKGLVVGAGGMVINLGGLQVLGGMQVVGGLVMQAPFTGGSTKGVTIHTGGLLVAAGGMTVHEKGLTVAKGLTIETGGLHIAGTGIDVRYGDVTIKGGLSLEAGGISAHAMAIHEKLEVSTAGILISAGGLRSLDAHGNGLKLETGKLEVIGGLFVRNRVKVEDSGLLVTAGGLSIASGGLTVPALMDITGGLVVLHNMEHKVMGGITITGGLMFSHGMYIINGGWPSAMAIDVEKGGLTVASEGMVITGGLTLGEAGVGESSPSRRKGLIVTAGGLQINDLGLKLSNGGFTINNVGLTVTAGGAKIQLGGFTLKDGMTVAGGMFASNPTGGGNALNVIDSSLTVVAGGVSIQYGGVVTNHLINIETGMVIAGYPGNIKVDGGIALAASADTIIQHGIGVTGGIRIPSGGFNISSRFADSARNARGHLIPNTHSIAGGLMSQAAVTVKNGLNFGVLLNSPSSRLQVTIHEKLVVTAGGVLFAKTTGLNENRNGVKITGLTDIYGGVRSHGLIDLFDGGLTNDGLTQIEKGGMLVQPTGTALPHQIHKDGVVTDSLSLDSVLNTTYLSLTVPGAYGSPHKKYLNVVSGGIDLDGPVGLNINATKWLGQIKRPGIHIMAMGMRINNGGLLVKRNGAYVSSLVEVLTDGLVVNDVGISISNGGLKIFDTSQLLIDGGLTVKIYDWYYDSRGYAQPRNWKPAGLQYANFQLTGGLRVATAGMQIADGLVLDSGSINSLDEDVIVNGQGIVSAGLDVVLAGMSVLTGGLDVYDGVVTNELTVVGKVNVNQKGLVVTAGGVEVTAGGVFINGGLRWDTAANVVGAIGIDSLTCSAGTIIHTGTLTVTSDRRLKENIVRMTTAEASQTVQKLRGVYFDWSQDHVHSRRLALSQQEKRGNSTDFAGLPARRVGFIAQEVQAVLPDLTSNIHLPFSRDHNATSSDMDTTTKSGTEPLLGIAYTDVVPYLVMCAKDLDARLSHEIRLASQTQAQQKASLLSAMLELEGMLSGAEQRSGAMRESLRVYRTQASSNI